MNTEQKMREALHRISLASQNSMSSKEECRRIAREALAEQPAQGEADDAAEDAKRFRWLFGYHKDHLTRLTIFMLLRFLSTRSLIEARRDIDAAMLAPAKLVKV